MAQIPECPRRHFSGGGWRRGELQAPLSIRPSMPGISHVIAASLTSILFLLPTLFAHAADADPAITVTKQLASVEKPLLSGAYAASKGVSKIEVMVDNQAYSAQTPAPGVWIVIVENAIKPGIYDVSARVTDQAGGTAMDNTVGELTIDASGPQVVVNKLVASDSTPELSGTLNDSSGVREATVKVGAETISAEISGMIWKAQLKKSLKPGVYDVAVEAKDALGNTQSDETKDELVIDGAAPVITVDPIQTPEPSPALGGAVQDDHGITSVEIQIEGKHYTATYDGKGRWSLPGGTIDPGLAEGVYDVQSTAKDEACNTSTDTTTDELTIKVVTGSNEEDKS